ncbi:hypothetical protein N657DRAFT_641659 [Parathielavia appendiculata]|uniref:Uncharacterized protein n=1 Tax=Parathielavia appendiculata TaxID=2587402 RepID=A0AAN6U731_9PEZI|nr:hypothetical protein N657DRAFT_641659 [Parathielavia appendiculata]
MDEVDSVYTLNPSVASYGVLVGMDGCYCSVTIMTAEQCPVAVERLLRARVNVTIKRLCTVFAGASLHLALVWMTHDSDLFKVDSKGNVASGLIVRRLV